MAVQAVPSSQPASTFGDEVHTQVERENPITMMAVMVSAQTAT